jgi:CheY-like chemotaxis protein
MGENMPRKKILLVDDSSTVLMMERMILGKASYEIAVAVDGFEAVERARAERPDLILMDIVMPRLDGFGAIKAIRDDPGLKHIPIVIVSTKSEAPRVDEAMRLGCQDYTTKPINGPELLAKIRALIGE